MDTALNSQSSSLLSQNGIQTIVISQSELNHSIRKNGKDDHLRIGDSNSLGSCSQDVFTFTGDINANYNRINLGFNELSYSVPDPTQSMMQAFRRRDLRPMKTIIHGVSGEFKPGELTAIMGPSGSGKTTLLNILAGFKTNYDGSVLVNGQPRDLSTFRKQARYIMQNDVLLPNLSVIEAMTFAAQLKMPVRTSPANVSARVSQILQMMDLYDCATTRTCHLSGGERKRLAISLELITDPPVLLFDEATTGLDSASCYSCVSLLKTLARAGGRTIVATIHQPSAKIFELFDSVYLIADGHCLYQGPTKSLVQFLETQSLNCPLTYNPADFVLDVASGEYGKDSVLRLREVTKTSFKMSRKDGSSSGNSTADYEQSDTRNKDQLHISVERLGAFKQLEKSIHEFAILLKRSWICILRDWMLTHLRFALTILTAVFLGLVYQGHGNSASNAITNCAGVYFEFIFLVFTSLFSTVLTFPLEREVTVRELLNCWYSLKSYYWARNLADLPFQIFYPVVCVSIIYYMSDQPLEWHRFLLFCLMGLLLSLICQSIGLFYGSFCSLETSVFVATCSTMTLAIFSGVFMKLATIPVYLQWLGHISHVRHSVQVAIYALYGFDRDDLHCDVPHCLFKHPVTALEEVDADQVNVFQSTVILLAMLAVSRIFVYFGLRYKVSQIEQ